MSTVPVAGGDGPTEQTTDVEPAPAAPDADLEPATEPPARSPSDPAPGPAIESLVWATWALFLGLGLMLTGAGLFGTLIAVRSELDGFSSLSIGFVSGAYYAGFLAGSRVTLHSLGNVGHIRVYAALASLLSAAIMTAGFATHPVAWIGLRFLAGACLAGQFVVAESWLNQLVSNQQRGRLLSIYTLVTVVAYGVGQFSFTRLDPNALAGFGAAAILISVAVAPVALSAAAAPPVVAAPERMTLRELWSIVPTGLVTSQLVGVTHGAFLGLGAVYATRSGLSVPEIGLFVAMPTLGSLILSVPISSASDGVDRRLVGALAAAVAGGAAAVLLQVGPEGWPGLLCMVVIGGTTYPLYSIAGAYTNDWVPTAKLTAASSQLVLMFGTGALLGPVIGALVMGAVGADGFVWMTIGSHATIALFLTVRILQHPAAVRAKPWNAVPTAGRLHYLPATAVAMGRRLRPMRRRRRPPGTH
ncbi:MAG: MFS transporter [Ilumatobacter sp.]|uniref:MFS transporter n=1 Tax=Ilumatobacter sp. TaxID=1967498 RepID=UPI0026249353|nr:MFS transporter [Ilumatobacter sp.]MDJ0769099.1 MFS transporter [Ilumatobacter sp.]